MGGAWLPFRPGRGSVQLQQHMHSSHEPARAGLQEGERAETKRHASGSSVARADRRPPDRQPRGRALLTTQKESASGPAAAGLSPARTSSSATPRRVCTGCGCARCCVRYVDGRGEPRCPMARQGAQRSRSAPNSRLGGRTCQLSCCLQHACSPALSRCAGPPPTHPPHPPPPPTHTRARANPHLCHRAQPLRPGVGKGLHLGRLTSQLLRRLVVRGGRLVSHVLRAGHAVAVLHDSKVATKEYT